LQKKQPASAYDRILDHIRTLEEGQIIEDMFISYSDAMDFIIYKGLRIDYSKWAKDRELYIEIDRRLSRPKKEQPKKWEN